ncbi:DUF4190 domain-containing protein [Actinosynnema sp. NPDC020468]|uniref:DUF4190 domain-containing protein n=1 Tax=Actinosynnema sp. NPDC020468 TaxID=3154488 RepID=UPI0033D1A2F0
MSQQYPPPPGYYPPPMPPRGTNGLAIASLILAFVFAPVGIVLGIMARNQIRRTGEDGMGLATAGMILSIVFTAIGIIAVILWIAALAYVVKTVDQLPTDFPTDFPTNFPTDLTNFPTVIPTT